MTIKTSVFILALLGTALVSSALTYLLVTSNTPEVVCPAMIQQETQPVQRQYKKTRKIPYNDGERF